MPLKRATKHLAEDLLHTTHNQWVQPMGPGGPAVNGRRPPGLGRVTMCGSRLTLTEDAQIQEDFIASPGLSFFLLRGLLQWVYFLDASILRSITQKGLPGASLNVLLSRLSLGLPGAACV